jgi:hypothetical protein
LDSNQAWASLTIRDLVKLELETAPADASYRLDPDGTQHDGAHEDLVGVQVKAMALMFSEGGSL